MKKKIIFALPTLQGGGAEKVISSLALNLDSKKYEVIMIVFSLSKQKHLKNEKIKIINLKNKRISLGIYRFIKCIKQIQPDVIISTIGHLNLMISLIKILLPKKTKLIARESNFLSKNIKLQTNSILMTILYKLFYNNFDLSLVFSRTHKKDMLSNSNINKDKVKIIYNPIDFHHIKKLSKKKINNKYNKYFINSLRKFIFVGSLSFQKGIDIFINILDKCKNQNFIYNIIGEGSEFLNLKKLVKEKNLSKKINFIPYQKNPFPYIVKSDAFIMSSRFEGMSNIILETLSLNKQIIFFDGVGASTEILKKMHNTHLIKKKSITQSAKFIDTYKINKRQISNFNNLQKFSLLNVVKSYEKIIDDLF